jgi:GNAT superfamily N-acetyltransferase
MPMPCTVRAAVKAHDAVDPFPHGKCAEPRATTGATLLRLRRQVRKTRLVAEVEERVVGYSRIVSWPEADGTWVYLTLGWVLPEWRGKGIGTAMLHWTENRIRRLATAEHPDAKCEFAANASSTEPEATALLLHEGYQVAYTVLEMGHVASAPVPAHALRGIECVLLPEHYGSLPQVFTKLTNTNLLGAGSMKVATRHSLPS